ncbi:hypothetical protein SYJ56_06665 [Algoriphagus sp. D3-2-R+10]|uniref:hypothetical protein n=1 Tax=Algoriphagus aurantiacus TaxID=3103948 RepID=UPI002B380C6F|nr:hypothetical protein [Algoriphagus sp. D3-2-R+10]MEB2774980.1 hypothetical protein [Algoriphagus sp. D3-2-R+10]
MNLFISNINNSCISIGGDIQANYSSSDPRIFELLLKSLEINRNLIAGIITAWESETEMIEHLKSLMEAQKNLELEISDQSSSEK